jgi:RHS repeat-associated protein
MPVQMRYGNLLNINNPTGTNASRTLTFAYGPEHQRVKQSVELDANAPAALQSGAGTSWYLNGEDSQGLSYEREEKTNGITEHKHYLSAGGMVFAMHVTRSGNLAAGNAAIGSNQPSSLRYFHHDQLGSIAAITEGNPGANLGAVIERLAYDPWGKRRNANGLSDVTDSLVGLTTDRGFTMHEHLDEMGVVHMNGRIYDPLIGRFMSADPILQAPSMLQSHNRYAYVMNNPLNLTDPSGFSWWTRFRDKVLKPVVIGYIGFLTGGLASSAYLGSVLGGSSFVIGGSVGLTAGIIGGAAGGFAVGALSTGTLKGGFEGALTGGLFGGVGASFSAGSAASYAGHAAAGCISSAAGGGSCGTGAASALFGKFTSNQIAGIGGQDLRGDIARGIATSVAGGLGSIIAGGKFENGAKTAAFGYLFNEVASRGITLDQRGYQSGNFVSSGFHEYLVETAICDVNQSGCTEQRVFDALRKYPAPQRFGSPDREVGVNTGDESFALGLGKVSHWVGNRVLTNTTIAGEHILEPGTVIRSVLTVGSTVFVKTEGYGMGIMPQVNSGQAAQWVWSNRTDGKIKSALGF